MIIFTEIFCYFCASEKIKILHNNVQIFFKKFEKK